MLIESAAVFAQRVAKPAHTLLGRLVCDLMVKHGHAGCPVSVYSHSPNLRM